MRPCVTIPMSLMVTQVSHVRQCAELLGVSPATCSRWMSDHGAPPRRAYLLQWAAATGVDPQWLTTGVEPRSPDGDGQDRPDLAALTELKRSRARGGRGVHPTQGYRAAA